MDLKRIEFTGDLGPSDWERWFGESWESYTAPIRELKDRMTAAMAAGQSPARCDLVRDRFVRMVDQSGRTPFREMADSITRFYASDLYDRLMAFDASESGFLRNSVEACFAGAWEGEQHKALIDLTDTAFNGSLGEIVVYVHGFGHGQLLLGMAEERGAVDGFSYVANDVWSPTRGLLVDAIQRYTNVRVYNHWLPPFYSGISTLRPDSVHAVHSCEVMEHIPKPELVLRSLCRTLRMGGYFLCSTFFNDMNGHDPQHLIDNNKYQDSDKWYAELEKAGLEMAWSDPRGVPKIWRKVKEPIAFEVSEN